MSSYFARKSAVESHATDGKQRCHFLHSLTTFDELPSVGDLRRRELRMAAEAGTDYSGVLCGRATWKEAIPVYAKQGAKALEDWLSDQGVKNINAVNEAIKPAKPWYLKAGLTAATV